MRRKLHPCAAGALPRLAALALLLALPAASAGWSVPEGVPYEAEERVVLDALGHRVHLAHAHGLLAWIEPSGGEGSAQVGDLLLLDPASGEEPEVLTHAASHPALGGRHVAWRNHSNAGDWSDANLGDGTVIHVLDRATGEARALSGSPARHAPPRMEGDVLAWARLVVGPGGVPEVHRVNLTTGEHEAWPSPVDACQVDEAHPAGGLLVLRVYECREGAGGVYVWNPADGNLTHVTRMAIDLAVHAGRIAWTEYREGEGRGTNVYVHDLSTGATSRATLSPGRETAPTLSGDLLAWADTARTLDDGRGGRGRVAYDVYFKDLGTANEYKLAGTHAFTAGPALDGRALAYADAEGRLRVATLPPPERLLVASVNATLDDLTQGALNLTLDASVDVDVAWDTDLDGVFDADGPLVVPLDDAGMPDATHVVGRAVDADGRVAVMSVDVVERVNLLRSLRAVLPDALPGEPPQPGDADVSEDDGPLGERTGGARAPGPGVLFLAAAAVLAGAWRGRAGKG